MFRVIALLALLLALTSGVAHAEMSSWSPPGHSDRCLLPGTYQITENCPLAMGYGIVTSVPLPRERPDIEWLTTATIYWLIAPVPQNVRGLHGNQVFTSLDECRRYGQERIRRLRTELHDPRAT